MKESDFVPSGLFDGQQEKKNCWLFEKLATLFEEPNITDDIVEEPNNTTRFYKENTPDPTLNSQIDYKNTTACAMY